MAKSLELHVEFLLQYKRRVSCYACYCFLAVAEMALTRRALNLRFSIGQECNSKRNASRNGLNSSIGKTAEGCLITHFCSQANKNALQGTSRLCRMENKIRKCMHSHEYTQDEYQGAGELRYYGFSVFRYSRVMSVWI